MHVTPLRARSLLSLLGCAVLLVILAALLPDHDSEMPGGDCLELFPSEPLIKALLTRLDPGSTIELGSQPLEVRDGAGQSFLLEGGGTAAVSLEALDIDGQSAALPVTLQARGPGGTPLLDRHYEGLIRIQADGERILVINELPMETYLAGVIFPEMGAWFPDEALKAQALASRSYAVHHRLRRASRAWHVGATQRSQVYLGIPPNPERARRLVEATRGLVLEFEGSVVPGFFSSCCGGTTRPASEAFGGTSPAPLEGVTCGLCDRAPQARWTRRMPLDDLRRRLGWRDPIKNVLEGHRGESGRLQDLTLIQEEEVHELPVSRFRRAWAGPLPSSWITRVDTKNGELILKGRGFGHGVGLCQYGAHTLALAGQNCLEILHHFFPGASVVSAWNPAP